MDITGRARIVGDNVYTDTIVSSHRKRDAATSLDAVPYIFEDLVPRLREPIRDGDIVVAGHNFGCGSAMEIAVDVLVAAGVRAVIARSFSRTYYRNAINAGLPVIICDHTKVAEGDELMLSIGQDASLHNLTQGFSLRCDPVPDFAREVAEAGGLIEYFRRQGQMPKGIL